MVINWSNMLHLELTIHERKKENNRTCKTDFSDKVWRFQEKVLYLCTDFGTQCKL